MIDILKQIGDWLSSIAEKSIVYLSNEGLNVTPLMSKIILMLVFGFSIYFVLSVIEIPRKLIKYGLVLLFAFLMITILISLI